MPEGGSAVIFSAAREQDELMRKMSEALFEGKHAAGRSADGKTFSCRVKD